MFACVSKVRYMLVVPLITIGLAVVAFDQQRPLVAIKNVHTAQDIRHKFPLLGFFDLRVDFSPAVPFEERSLILTDAFDDERASRIVALDLSYNGLRQPPVLSTLSNLRELDLAGNELTEPPVLTNLITLREVILSGTHLVRPPVLTGLIHLKSLDLSSAHLSQAPVLTGLVNLRELDMRNNDLVQPPVLTGLTNLKKLFLNNNHLVEPPVLTGLINLKMLLLNNNQLNHPPVLTGLMSLEDLDLSENSFEQAILIPEALADRIDLENIHAPYQIEYEAAKALVDIAQPGVDRLPFFFFRESIARLPLPKRNPITRGPITQTRNLVESWRYWREQGMLAQAFDDKLREMEPVMLEENMYTVSPAVARAFMRERRLTEARIMQILEALSGETVNVTALLNAMYLQHAQQPQSCQTQVGPDAEEPPAKMRRVD